MQTGFRYARDEGSRSRCGSTATASTTRRELGKLLAPIDAGTADLVIGSRFVDPGGSYRPPFARRMGIRVFARLVSLLGGQKVTDTTSGFVALNRSGIELFAVEYPHDYPEVEATLVALRSGLRLAQVQVDMRERAGGDLVDHVRPVALLHRQGHARAARLQPPSLSATRGGAQMTPLRASIAGAIASIILILVVVELVRGRRLKERYALLWLATGVVLLVLSVWREGLNTLAGWFGVTGYPPAVLFAVATLFIFLVLLHYSTVVSRLTDENVDLAQRIALLEEKLSRPQPPAD